jgi:hypothetical protein
MFIGGVCFAASTAYKLDNGLSNNVLLFVIDVTAVPARWPWACKFKAASFLRL